MERDLLFLFPLLPNPLPHQSLPGKIALPCHLPGQGWEASHCPVPRQSMFSLQLLSLKRARASVWRGKRVCRQPWPPASRGPAGLLPSAFLCLSGWQRPAQAWRAWRLSAQPCPEHPSGKPEAGITSNERTGRAAKNNNSNGCYCLLYVMTWAP